MQSLGTTSCPRKPMQTTGSGNREPRGFHAAGSYRDIYGEKGGLGKAAPLEVNPGKAAWRSVPRAAGPKREQMTCRRQATRKARQVFGRNYS